MRAKDFIIESAGRILGGFPVKVVAKINNDVDEAIQLDAPHRRMGRDEVQGLASRIKSGTKTTKDKMGPIVHQKQIVITKSDDPNDVWNLDDLAAKIMRRPTTLIGTNAKMEKSAAANEWIYDITLPALKGIVIDEETGEFVEITTCPAAGDCKAYCYARKGGYVMFPNAAMSSARSLNFLVNDPEGYADVVDSEIRIQSRLKPKGDKLVVRWHDAGDFFSKAYLNLAYDVARKNPTVDFYAYTKVADYVIGDAPANFIMNFSSGAAHKEQTKITKHVASGGAVKQGITVPKDMFFDLIARKGNSIIKDEKGRTQFKDDTSVQMFKQRLAKAYNVHPSTILTYDQMLSMPVGPEPKWNVIVQPGAGDRAANRKDVINSFLMFH